MGQSLALNIAEEGYDLSVYNIESRVTNKFLDEQASNKQGIVGFDALDKFVGSLEAPRRILLMITAGDPIDQMLDNLEGLLDDGDLVIDGGNSHFRDTMRRKERLQSKGLLYLGLGISGGQEGARKGPSLMPGGSEKGWEMCEDMLVSIAAKLPNGQACCKYMGDSGAGHYVKMVHNGIEYAEMQAIAESYHLMRAGLNMNNLEIADQYENWNQGDLQSYLMEITIQILRRMDAESTGSLVDLISDIAFQKGTGKWTSQEALDLGIAIPSLTESVYVRYVSMKKEERVRLSSVYSFEAGLPGQGSELMLEDLKAAMIATKISIFAQGFSLLNQASEQYGWKLSMSDISMVWMNGCIIRARLLDSIYQAFMDNPKLDNLLLNEAFIKKLNACNLSWRRVVSSAVLISIPVTAISSALGYFDLMTTENLPTNLIQAQRDCFGAHTYQRADREGVFHTEWK